MDASTAKTKRSSVVLGRAFVVIQWLLFLQRTSPHCFNIPEKILDPSKWQETDGLMRRANDCIMKDAKQVTRKEDIVAEDRLGADIAETSRVSLPRRTPQDENVPLFADRGLPFVAVELEAEATMTARTTEGNDNVMDSSDDEDESFPLRHSLVTDRNATEDCKACRKVQLNALAKEFLSSSLDCHAEPRQI
jgi:hypothetical protein